MTVNYLYFIIGPTAISFGQGSGPIALNNVVCTGTEARLIDCPSGTITGCTHAHDVGVRCSREIGIKLNK